MTLTSPGRERDRPRDIEQAVTTPTLRRFAKRSLFWVGIVTFALLIVLVTLVITGSNSGGTPLDPTNPAPAGSKALAEVLRQQGVEVIPTSSLAETRDAASAPESTTILVYDADGLLTSAQLTAVTAMAGSIILVEPTFDQLDAVAPSVAQAGYVEAGPDAGLVADCPLPAVRKAGSVSGDASGYRLIGSDDGVLLCLGSGDDVYSLIRLESAASTITVLGTTGALSNEFITERGNAALAINLLGETETLLWYLPGIDDLAEGVPPTLAELTPPWVTPVIVLLIISAVAAAVWRGRRMGPLVVENLPVTVRASETMNGRARLYATASARLRALDSLRVGAIDRLARLCGLPRLATVEEVVSAIAAVTRIDQREVRRILVDANPSTDHQLVRLSDDLLTLERTVEAAVRPH